VAQATIREAVPHFTALTGRDVRLLRLVRDLTQEELAKRSGLSVPTISLIEAGKRPLRADREIALVRALFP
jgi:transcriptional regulator with XRE-family HTH domain